jgi:hypothetical protein
MSDVDETWFVVLEGFLRCDRFALGLRNQIQARHAFALEKTGDAGAGYIGIDVLLRNEQQVVEWQVKRLTQCQDDGLLGRAQGRVQCMSTRATILYIVAPQPFLCSGSCNVEHSGRLLGRQAGILDLLADFRRGSGLRVDERTHAANCSWWD